MLNQKRFRFLLTFVETCEIATKRSLARAFSLQSKSGKNRFVFAVRRAEYDASKWIARLNADDVSPEDGARFEAWRKRHPRHARAYEDLVATWRQLTASKSVDGA